MDNKCLACIENQENQMAHMVPGGCLYETDDSDIEEEELEPVGLHYIIMDYLYYYYYSWFIKK